MTIRQRSKRQSAVAGAAYQSGEKLFSEYDLKTKNYSYKSGEVLAKGILLPPNALLEYADRQTLWNAVEKAENQWNSQLARGIIMALPNEIPSSQAKTDTLRKSRENQGILTPYLRENTNVPIAGYLYSMQITDETSRLRDKPVWQVDVCAALPEAGNVRGGDKQ